MIFDCKLPRPRQRFFFWFFNLKITVCFCAFYLIFFSRGTDVILKLLSIKLFWTSLCPQKSLLTWLYQGALNTIILIFSNFDNFNWPINIFLQILILRLSNCCITSETIHRLHSNNIIIFFSFICFCGFSLFLFLWIDWKILADKIFIIRFLIDDLTMVNLIYSLKSACFPTWWIWIYESP